MWYRKTARGLELQPHFFLENAKTVKMLWTTTNKKSPARRCRSGTNNFTRSESSDDQAVEI